MKYHATDLLQEINVVSHNALLDHTAAAMTLIESAGQELQAINASEEQIEKEVGGLAKSLQEALLKHQQAGLRMALAFQAMQSEIEAMYMAIDWLNRHYLTGDGLEYGEFLEVQDLLATIMVEEHDNEGTDTYNDLPF